MSEPPLTKSPEARALREASTAWGKAIDDEPADDADTQSQRLWRALSNAALAYANAVHHAQPVLKHEAPPPRKKPVNSHPSGETSNAQPVRWQCVTCGRDRFTRRTAHKCIGGYRKRHLKWRAIYAESTE